MDQVAATQAVRSIFLAEGGLHGCAETAFMVLKARYGLPDPADSAAAMALNGGLAYSGGPCGAVTGAALAIGLLAARRLPDHQEAKLMARGAVAALLDDFETEFGAVDCRSLTGVDLRAPGGHDAFLASGAWRTACLRQLEFVVGRVGPLADDLGRDRRARPAEPAADPRIGPAGEGR
ncbi:MAG TPA: C-GCAxxG-C-C family protein [Candidatus Limnocylindrales bacterium]|nr:C-GCAxxG-C-C family protein [Candidatus Limnocylindrales bacterium]